LLSNILLILSVAAWLHRNSVDAGNTAALVVAEVDSVLDGATSDIGLKGELVAFKRLILEQD
jgi:hypothetical protein